MLIYVNSLLIINLTLYYNLLISIVYKHFLMLVDGLCPSQLLFFTIFNIGYNQINLFLLFSFSSLRLQTKKNLLTPAHGPFLTPGYSLPFRWPWRRCWARLALFAPLRAQAGTSKGPHGNRMGIFARCPALVALRYIARKNKEKMIDFDDF